MEILIQNIKELIQTNTTSSQLLKGKEMGELSSILNAWVKIKDGTIEDFGSMNTPYSGNFENVQLLDATGKMVFPSWCDSHTHIVYAGSREAEFVDKINGLGYEEIAANGGGILNSAKRLQDASEEELFEQASARLEEIMRMGTGAVEIKSGYGLTVDAEIKILRVIKRLKETSPLKIKATFLGAHTYPLKYKENHQGYIDEIIHEMLPIIEKENLADYIDAFCEKVAFSPEETDQIVKAGAKIGLKAKIHTNQFNCMGGIEMSVANNAVSVDHLEVLTDEEIECLKNSSTIATLLPSAPFFLRDHYPPARKIIEAGVPVALATDYNPGSTPSGKMSFVLSLACIYMRMTPEEAINAATINGAFAMELGENYGSIDKGKVANLFITKPIPSYSYLPYSFGSDHVETVILNGKVQ
ncbi:imidazolonepropionase [Acidiluteibacter ferrifornacis]|uniref:Imidazolonepropionase n=1 Tax=Acidiluteibacter ferrifornacis TaxID=2692424 RepID=A0A6N9NQ62_9FLAO|nr:imidazolonepropionase [Acidiluteibacter ferrifornacis]NBG67430.1 imidazolonepropionase [Acidiluteibacter ferrifornacis]